MAAARLAGAMGDLNGNMSRGRRTGRLLTLYRSKGLFGALFERGSRGIHNLSHPFLYQVIVCQYLKECILSGRHAKQNTMKKGGKSKLKFNKIREGVCVTLFMNKKSVQNVKFIFLID